MYTRMSNFKEIVVECTQVDWNGVVFTVFVFGFLCFYIYMLLRK